MTKAAIALKPFGIFGVCATELHDLVPAGLSVDDCGTPDARFNPFMDNKGNECA